MIVTITLPAGKTSVFYGQSNMIADGAADIEVPDYVAKTLLTLPGVTGPTLSSSAASLLSGVSEDFEANYIFRAYGKALPDSGRIASASALMTANGEPAVSIS